MLEPISEVRLSYGRTNCEIRINCYNMNHLDVNLDIANPKMLNPLEMNFYGTRNEGSYGAAKVAIENNEISNTTNQISHNNSKESNKNLIQDEDNHKISKNDGIGKWVDPDKGNRDNADPYPNISNLRKYHSSKEKNLPKKLQDLITPLKCNLCNCAMSSTVTAKDHYDGKKHKTNIKKWLLDHPEYCEKVNNEEPVSPPKILDPDKLYCKYCDLMLSSKQQAQSHYLGKKHQNVINNKLIKNAYFNPTKGYWERLPKGSTTGKFGIGLAFLTKDSNGKDALGSQKLFCEICQVPCPSEISLNDHLAGSKHKKKLALLSSSESTHVAKDNILEEVIKNDKKIPSATDLSIYRTPSGKYYCHGCDVTVNSPVQFLQHSASRKHKNKTVLATAKCSNK